MRSSSYVALFASGAIALDTATVLVENFLARSLTLLDSDASATTYANICPAGNGGGGTRTISHDSTLTPSTTPKPMRRQDNSNDDSVDDLDVEEYFESLCENFTVTQGAETAELHFTDPKPDEWTKDLDCTWKGDIRTAAFTCTTTQQGWFPNAPYEPWVQSSVIATDARYRGNMFQVVPIVSATGARSSDPSTTPVSPTGTHAGSGSGATSSTASSSGSGAASPTVSGSGSESEDIVLQSAGFAPAGPLPTGAVAFVGGAVGILAAALAL